AKLHRPPLLPPQVRRGQGAGGLRGHPARRDRPGAAQCPADGGGGGDPPAGARLAVAAPAGGEAMNAHRRARLAWSLWALSVALLVGYIPLRAAARAFAAAPGTPLPPHGVELLAMSVPGMVEDLFLHTAYVAFSTLGAFIVARR